MRNKGFTLLEILIALFIFTIIAIIMTRALHTVLITQAVTDEHAARLSELQFSTLLLSRDLEQTLNRSIKDKDNKDEAAFIGTNNKVIFTHGGLSNPQGQLRRTTLQRTAYFFEKDNLIRQTWNVLDQSSTSKSNQRILLTHIKDLQIEYLDQQNHFNKNWPAVSGTSPLPRAVRISIALTDWGTLTQLYIIPGKTNETAAK